jgi:hypothetical protein
MSYFPLFICCYDEKLKMNILLLSIGYYNASYMLEILYEEILNFTFK